MKPRLFLERLLLLCSLVFVVEGSVNWPHLRRQTNDTNPFLPPPSLDPWFRPLPGWEKTKPGTVLRTRMSPYKFLVINNAVNSFQFIFRTNDAHNNASWAVSTIFIPKSQMQCSYSKSDACSHGLVSYQLPYDTADPDAGPSYLMQFGDPYGELQVMLSYGWFVNVPDFEGPLASYCSGKQSGHATLDSIKAALQVVGQFGFRTDQTKTVLWGYSGGATATEFAMELASSYAPDLKLNGAIVGGLVPNLTTGAEMMNGRGSEGLLISCMLGITSQHSEARDYLESKLNPTGPYNATTFLSAGKMSASEAILRFSGQNVYKYFENGFADMFGPPISKMVENDAVMGYHGVPSMPSYFYKAVHDEFSAVTETDALVDKYCKQGANILYNRNSLGGHNEEIWAGHARAYAFMATILNGTPNITIPASNCSIANVTIGSDGLNAANATVLTHLPGHRRLDIFSPVYLQESSLSSLPRDEIRPRPSIRANNSFFARLFRRVVERRWLR